MEDLPLNNHIILSDLVFTLDKIAVKYLKHFIRNSDAKPNKEWKLILIDNNSSHIIPEFVDLANKNHICPYPLISYLTHYMQSLDIEIFQLYKHWYNMAIQKVISKLFIEYFLMQFLKNLTKIRNNIFKASIIQNAFEKSGM